MPELPDLGAIRFQKERDVGGVLNATIAFIKRDPRGVLVPFFAIAVPAGLLTGIATVLFSRSAVAFSDPAFMADPDDIGAVLGEIGVAYAVLLVCGLVAGSVAWATVGGIVRAYRQGDSLTVATVWDETRGLVLPMLGFFTIAALVAVLSAVINIIPCLGTIAYVAFIIWAFPHLSIALASRMTETHSMGDAWRRGRSLVKGAWGPTAGALLIAWVIAYVLAIAFSIPAYVVQFALSVGSEDPTQALQTTHPIWALISALSTVVYVIPLLTMFFVHGKLVAEVEGASLDDDLDLLADGGLDAGDAWSETAPDSGTAQDSDAPPSPPPAPRDAPRPGRDSGGFGGGGFNGGGFSGGGFGDDEPA